MNVLKRWWKIRWNHWNGVTGVMDTIWNDQEKGVLYYTFRNNSVAKIIQEKDQN